jgi:hypothetical protein
MLREGGHDVKFNFLAEFVTVFLSSLAILSCHPVKR